jgi:hypothetical protein
MIGTTNRFRDALAVQDACNPSGVCRSLFEIFSTTDWPDTDSKRRDPAVILFVAKLADLVGLEYTWPRDAQLECEKQADGAR